MKRAGLVLLLSFIVSAAVAQQQKKPSTYAVVVGIAGYENKGIPRLRYANRDADVFASYLRSNAGGNVPQENIRLLTDSNATTAAVYDALSWLAETSSEGDIVYFYFAGHGDMENETIHKLGFLLTYNTPRTNYINNAIRIEDLNNIANTISVSNKARVVIITDACHSGQLAGSNFRGNMLVGEQLRTVRSKEIRITSCATDQLSIENEAWGGGRGVFSFYLVKGLIGFAEKEKDGIVHMQELKAYLDSAFANDPVLKQEGHKQTPVLQGKNDFELSVVDKGLMKQDTAENKNVVSFTADPALAGLSNDSYEVQDLVFAKYDKMPLEQLFNFSEMEGRNAHEICMDFLKHADTRFRREYDQEVKSGLPGEENSIKRINRAASIVKGMDSLRAAISGDKDFEEQFQKKLMVIIHNRVQQAINLFLTGDEAELERRRYYSKESEGYGMYPAMIKTALKLAGNDEYMNRLLNVMYNYFSGVVLRLKIPMTENIAPLINEAYAFQQKALALETKAAYICNELGVLLLYKNKTAEAKEQFITATKLSPAWSIPWSNLVLVNTLLKDYSTAKTAYDNAVKLQPGLTNIYVNAGVLFERQKNLLLAEENFRKGIELNSRHYLPFERLGFVFMQTTQYAQADSFFFEADIRKRGYHFNKELLSVLSPLANHVLSYIPLCPFDTGKIKKNDISGNFAWAFRSLQLGDTTGAEKRFKHVISLDGRHPLAFHYLGKILYAQQRWQEGELTFNYAVSSFKETEEMYQYLDNLYNHDSLNADARCFLNINKGAKYEREEDHYFLASLYEKWNHYTEAEAACRVLIKMLPDNHAPYFKLWNLHEKLGRFDDAELVIQQYRLRNKLTGDNELNAFYERITALRPADGYWQHKAGRFLYYFVKENKSFYPGDLKTILPDQTEPSFVLETRPSGAHSSSYTISETGEEGEIAKSIELPFTDGIKYLLKADSLLADDETIADVNDKLGDLYMWQGLPTYSAKHYQKSVELQPINSGVRSKLVNNYDSIYRFSAAMIHMDTLYRRKEINYQHQKLLANYKMRAGNTGMARSLLKEIEHTDPLEDDQLYALNGLLELLSENYQASLKQYKKQLMHQPGDALIMYSIARLYAVQHKNGPAFQWLKKAGEHGFNYGYVLQYDPLFQKLRQTGTWKNWIGTISPKEYKLPAWVK
ncbi:MAG: caspase family protein [Ferruginibacter sp.]